MSNLRGKKIIVGVTGSIAAYKSALLVRLLVKEGAEVQVIMTPAATEFITPLTLATLSGRPVLIDFFDKSNGGEWNSHIELGLWADLMVIAPVTATTLGKMANGIADNLLLTTYLSCRAPVMIAPAMDMDMYAHPSTERSLQILKGWDVELVEPGRGELASHLIGKGRMEEPEEILRRIEHALKPIGNLPLEGMHFLITSGPTRERIDPVRYISNYSTGKMGAALAEVISERGGAVIFITGPVEQLPMGENIEIIKVESALEMHEACLDRDGAYDVAIFCAAVADYRADKEAEAKIKREGKEELLLHLIQNPDIAASLGAKKEEGQIHIGFALETEVKESELHRKMEAKNFDLLVVNSLQDQGAGFGTETNKVTIYNNRDELILDSPLASKQEIAGYIIETLTDLV
ncbi:MAG: bifunctional phosphopantothenoylcysteine decarboxylase/phosphopantothenate--cysteine ligase CoaBC [Porphyromonas sp.]|nr:bifunctional phosphopantothenoylcysteine decarboxylase/phosphopantothenate--cysteine ligase CoaBC [Porphyromonas sp.]